MENRDWIIEITIAFNSARILCYLEKNKRQLRGIRIVYNCNSTFISNLQDYL